MRCVCERELLNEALGAAVRAVSPKATMDVLKGILLNCENGKLTVTGNDLEMGISSVIPAKVEQEGAFVLDSRMISEIVRRASGEEVALSVDERFTASVICDTMSFDIMALPADNYPDLPDVAELRSLTLSQALLKCQLTQTLFSVSESEGKGIHTGALFDLEPGRLTIVALDGHRMALRHEEISNQEKFSFVIPGAALKEIEKMLSSDEESEVTLHIGSKHVLTELSGQTVISRLLEGDFLQYKNALPQECSFSAVLEVRPFIAALERVGLLITERLKNPVKLLFSENSLSVSCQTSLGRAQDDIPSWEAGELEIGFNHRYLLDALKKMESERFRFETSGPLSPCTLRPEDDGNVVFMVLPVRLKADL
ncbi:MAG: DNA polymerase III subunit beta [Oscillospiraceae bacterium]|nr:DNA polymerase III subunit beta [Oscillospiraceae bacterium]